MSEDHRDEEQFQSARSSISDWHSAQCDETFVKRWEYLILSIRERECQVCEIEDDKNVKVLKLPPNELGDSILKAFENCSGTVLIRYLECGTYKGVVSFRHDTDPWQEPGKTHLERFYEIAKKEEKFRTPVSVQLLGNAIRVIETGSELEISQALDELENTIAEEMNAKKLPNKKIIDSFKTFETKPIVTAMPGLLRLADYDEMEEASRSSNAPSAANNMEQLLAMKKDLLEQRADLREKLNVVEKKLNQVDHQMEQCADESFF